MKRTRDDRPIDERFWPSVSRGELCWEWQGSRSSGYGMVATSDGVRYAHRVAWELTKGPIPDGLYVCHECANRLCVRPDHLMLCTVAESAARAGLPHRKSLAERFWARVQFGRGCWEWQGRRSNQGYGYLTEGHKGKIAAHRLSFRLSNGDIPDGAHVLHRCDNPPCVRPDHLFLGDASSNQLDAISKGRQATGSRRWGAKLTESMVRDARAAAAAGETIGALAERFGVNRTTMSVAIAGHTWKHVK